MDTYLVKELSYLHLVSKNGTFGLYKEKLPKYDLTIMLSGELHYTINGSKLVLRKNDIMFLPPGTYRVRDATQNYVKYLSFNFLLFDGVELSLKPYMHNSLSENLKRLIELIDCEYLSPYFYSKERYTNLLNYILFELLNISATKSSNTHIHNIIKHIDENITKKITLQSISKEIGLTKQYTASIFKKEMGQTVSDYVNKRKILLAKELILSNKMSLSELACYLGFDNYTYFSRLFKRYFRASPKAFKPH